MGFPFGPKTKFQHATLTKNAVTILGSVGSMAGAVAFFVRAWVDKDVPSAGSSISTTNLTLGTAIPVALAAGTKVTGANVGTPTTIVSGTGTAAGSVYVVANSQTAAAGLIVFNNASTTGKITSFSMSPPDAAGTTNNWGSGWGPSVGSLAVVPAVAAAYNTVASQASQHLVPVQTSGSATAALAVPWAWPIGFFNISVDNTDATNNQTLVNVEVWPVYGFNSDPRAVLSDYSTF